jgi:hypothetical protein
MPLVIEGAQITEDWCIDASNAAASPHRLGHAGGDDIHFIITGHCQTEIRSNHSRLKQDAGLRCRTRNGAHIKFIIDAACLYRICIDQGYTVSFST